MPDPTDTMTLASVATAAPASIEPDAATSWIGAIGQAPTLLAIPEPVRALLDAGGPVMLILAGMSVLALTIVLMKLWQFASLRRGGAEHLETALTDWQAGRRREAVARLDRTSNPAARIVRTAMLGRLHENDPAAVREEVERQAGGLLNALRSHLRGLEIIASLSPLLGLLGTVIGMIEAFKALEAAGSQVDPGLLSGGIWVALLTTAAGLSVAIPTSVALTWLERLLEGATRRLEDQVTRVFTAGLRLDAPTLPERDPLDAAGVADAL